MAEFGDKSKGAAVADPFQDGIVNEVQLSDAIIEDHARIIAMVADIADPSVSASQRNEAHRALEARQHERFVRAKITLAYAATLPPDAVQRGVLEYIGRELEQSETALQHNLAFLRTLPNSPDTDAAIATTEKALKPHPDWRDQTMACILDALRAIGTY